MFFSVSIRALYFGLKESEWRYIFASQGLRSAPLLSRRGEELLVKMMTLWLGYLLFTSQVTPANIIQQIWIFTFIDNAVLHFLFIRLTEIHSFLKSSLKSNTPFIRFFTWNFHFSLKKSLILADFTLDQKAILQWPGP